MKRPKRTIRRESQVTYRGRPLILIVPPTADVLLIREKGRRTAYEVDIVSAFHLGARKAAAKLIAERKAKGRRCRVFMRVGAESQQTLSSPACQRMTERRKER